MNIAQMVQEDLTGLDESDIPSVDVVVTADVVVVTGQVVEEITLDGTAAP